MDRLESLSSTLSQITMYDIKSMYNQVRGEGARIHCFVFLAFGWGGLIMRLCVYVFLGKECGFEY